jgi:sec-independent protein translocase protein TatC
VQQQNSFRWTSAIIRPRRRITTKSAPDARRRSAMSEETFISHLMELRDRLLRSLIAIAIVFVCLFPWASELYDFLALPMMRALPEGSHMIATGVVTPFLIPVKVAVMVAFVIALPYVLYQVWAFVAPGLYLHEKKLVLPLVIASTVLFIVGIAFCYFFVFGVVFKFVNSIAPKSISVAPDIENYLNFVMTLFLAFGVTFEVPVAVIVLVRMGMVSIEQLKSFRPYFIVGSFVIAAVVTPPDVLSQVLLAVPLCVLYEAGIIVARLIGRQAAADSTEQLPP